MKRFGLATILNFSVTATLMAVMPKFQLEYRGEYRLGDDLPVAVTCFVMRNGDDIFVHSVGGSFEEKYLAIGPRALKIQHFDKGRDLTVFLTKPLFRSTVHIPYLPNVTGGSCGVDHQQVFLMQTGDSVISAETKPFTMPIKRRTETAGTTTIYASFAPGAWGEVVQSDFVEVGGLRVPKSSVERYEDGRGKFDYTWTLTTWSDGDQTPPLPTFESAIGRANTVNDLLGPHRSAFAFDPGKGSFDEQLAAGREFAAEIARENARESNAGWFAAIAAGGLTLAAGFVIYWRNRHAKTV